MNTTRSRSLDDESVKRFKEFVTPKPVKILDCPGCIYLKRCWNLGKWPCHYPVFSMVDYIIGQINIKLQLGRSIFWEPLGIKLRHILRLVYRIVYWWIQIKIMVTGAVTRDVLKRVHEHRVAILLAYNIFITSILVFIIAFLVLL